MSDNITALDRVCPVCDTPDGDHLDWCTPQARDASRSSKQCCHDPLDGRSTLRYEVDTLSHYVGIICTACGHGLHTPVDWPAAETSGDVLSKLDDLLQIMICSAEVFTDTDGTVTGYKIKTGALHKIVGLRTHLFFPQNMREASPSKAACARCGGAEIIRDPETWMGGPCPECSAEKTRGECICPTCGIRHGGSNVDGGF